MKNHGKRYDYLLVGAGLFNAIFAYLARQHGKRCLIIDKRSHLGGNLYCKDVEGICVHQYGPHVFHTNKQEVWKFVNSVVSFYPFTLNIMANHKGVLYNLPFNMNTFHQIWDIKTPKEAYKRIMVQRKTALGDTILPRNLEEQALSLVGKDLYEILVKGYTEKQWGRLCSELPPFIIKRLPVRYTYDNNYFNDSYQGLPEGGYNKLIDKLFQGVECWTDCDFFTRRGELSSLSDRTVYTGPIDAYFDYNCGKLQYRSLKFEHSIVKTTNWQGCAIMNYTSPEVPYTRIVEHKHFECHHHAIQDLPHTVITHEYPTATGEPYYPINDARNSEIYKQYQQQTLNERNTIFGGRLATYKYMDMDDIVESAIEVFNMHNQ